MAFGQRLRNLKGLREMLGFLLFCHISTKGASVFFCDLLASGPAFKGTGGETLRYYQGTLPCLYCLTVVTLLAELHDLEYEFVSLSLLLQSRSEVKCTEGENSDNFEIR